MRIVGFSWLHSFNGIFSFQEWLALVKCEEQITLQDLFLWKEASFCMITRWRAVIRLLNKFYPPPLQQLVFWNYRRLQAILYNSLNKDTRVLAAKVLEQEWAALSERVKEKKKEKATHLLISLVKCCDMLLLSVRQCDVSFQFKMVLQAHFSFMIY